MPDFDTAAQSSMTKLKALQANDALLIRFLIKNRQFITHSRAMWFPAHGFLYSIELLQTESTAFVFSSFVRGMQFFFKKALSYFLLLGKDHTDSRPTY
jgi:hypothetical protein